MTLGRSSKALGHTVKNLASSLIQYENIITTPAKADLAAGYVQNLITKTIKHSKSPESLKEWRHLLHGQLYNPEITIPKLIDVLAPRYQGTTGPNASGVTRELKIENRFGDNAPQVILEMVGNADREMKLWINAKTIARLELQGLEIDPLSKKNMEDCIRTCGEAKWLEIVQTCKDELFNDHDMELKPRMKKFTNGFNKQFTNFEFVKREPKDQ